MVSAKSRGNHLERACTVDVGRRCCTGWGGGLTGLPGQSKQTGGNESEAGGLRRLCSAVKRQQGASRSEMR